MAYVSSTAALQEFFMPRFVPEITIMVCVAQTCYTKLKIQLGEQRSERRWW